MPLTRTRTSLDYEDDSFSSSFYQPYHHDLNRSIYRTPTGCSLSYRMNMTIHDPLNMEDEECGYERKIKGSRLSRALKELLGRSSSKKEVLSHSCYIPSSPTTEPRKRRGSSMNRSGTLNTSNNFSCYPTYATPLRQARAYHRTPSADAAVLLDRTLERRRKPPAPIRIQSFALPEPRVVQFRQPKLRRQHKAKEIDAFVNSHEWTLSRGISELRVGVVGEAESLKNSLIHRYLTGVYKAEESPEGGRFKKEVVIDGQSHLLLIRDEGHTVPEAQFTLWADALIFVFGLDSRESFLNIPNLFKYLRSFRNLSEMPLILVGNKDGLVNRPRVVSEEEGQKMANDWRMAYYETNSDRGINVERVFKDACHRILQCHRPFGSNNGGSFGRTPTPTTPSRGPEDKQRAGDYQRQMASTLYNNGSTTTSQPLKNVYHQRSSTTAVAMGDTPNNGRKSQHVVNHREGATLVSVQRTGERALSSAYPLSMSTATTSSQFSSRASQLDHRDLSPSSSQKSLSNGLHTRSSTALLDSQDLQYGQDGRSLGSASTSHLPTPSSTPTTQRKNRRISNIFQRPKDSSEEKIRAIEQLNLGAGRAIPIKQGILHKKSSKSYREWKKKYVCLYSDGRLSYHQNLKDYMEKGARGKEVFLGLATVKVAGRQRPRNTQRMATSQTDDNSSIGTERKSDAGEGTSGGGSDDAKEGAPPTPQSVSSQKKRHGGHRRLASSGKHADDDEECFEIVTCDQTRWEFCASSAEEREEWVSAIEEQIEKALQNQMSQPSNRAHGCAEEIKALRQLPGNNKCADCGAPNPVWASLNLGTLICIECCGIHRNLGSHVSRVRSLELDDWPVECLAVMQAIGNTAANQLWEHNAPLDRKPQADSPRDQKESWIRSKYEQKRFLPPLRVDETVSSQLVKAVLDKDVARASLLLARATPEDVNAHLSARDRRTPLFLACSVGSLEMVQLLLWNNADIMALDEEGRSCLWHAQHQGFEDCAQVLLAAGLMPDYGKPTVNSHRDSTINEGVIMGSLSNRDYSYVGEDRDVMMRRQSASKRNNFDYLPASII